MDYETLKVDHKDKIAYVTLHRPNKANALNEPAWRELKHIFETLDATPEVRAIIISGEGKHFCAGIDLGLLMSLGQLTADDCEGRRREKTRQMILDLQAPINAIEACRKPVLAAIHGACVGAGVDLVSACDMRYATDEAFFAIAEIDMGLVADIGTLQRLPKLIGDGMARELAYTGRRVYGPEAKTIGIVNHSFADKETLLTEVTALATMIAAKSPLAIRGSKEIIKYTRDHSVAEGLTYVATWNAAMVFSQDLTEALQAKLEKRDPHFKD